MSQEMRNLVLQVKLDTLIRHSELVFKLMIGYAMLT